MYADIDQRAVEGTGGANDVTNRDSRLASQYRK
ncbi:hypothetical protein SeGA_4038, partial [Salmonella enterica subsp. enterica serovar Gaminara str. A4-567]